MRSTIFAFSILFLSLPALSKDYWDYEFLPLLPGYVQGGGRAINNKGDIVGVNALHDGNATRLAVLWKNRVPVSLGLVPGSVQSEAVDINEAGQIIGASIYATDDGGYIEKPFIGTESGLSELPLPPGGLRGNARDINDAGSVVGGVILEGEIRQAVAWTNGQTMLLPPLEGDVGAVALTTDNSGRIFGTSFSASNAQRLVFWEDGVAMDFSSRVPTGFAVRVGLSDVGIIGGQTTGGAFLYDINEQRLLLVDPSLRFLAVSSSGKAAFWSPENLPGSSIAGRFFIWQEETLLEITDRVNFRFAPVRHGYGIGDLNDSLQLLGSVFNLPQAGPAVFVPADGPVVTIPEPSTSHLLLLGLASVGLAAISRRKAPKKARPNREPSAWARRAR